VYTHPGGMQPQLPETFYTKVHLARLTQKYLRWNGHKEQL